MHWRLLPIVAALSLAGAMIASGPAVGQLLSGFDEPTVITPEQFTVTDGDTIRVIGEPSGTRLVGFNAPETSNAACARERLLGDRATERLKDLVAAGGLTLVKVACACRPGTEGTDACNFGRSCGTLRANGRDVGDILMAEGLAVPFVCGATRCPPTPRPWCE